MIDWSSTHNIWIKSPDGTLQRMDEPYYKVTQIDDGTWMIQSDGDATYLVEGDREAMVIDSGYGCGNIREYCQTLTDKPIYNIINTHDHFDHTANNCYFDHAYMTKETATLATIPFPSFAGIDFPRDYPKIIVKEGDIIDLGNRTLEVIEMHDHAIGSLLLLDKTHKILFAGDEIWKRGKSLNGTVEYNYQCFKKLEAKKEYIKTIWIGGFEGFGYEVIQAYLDSLKYILDGNHGVKLERDYSQNNRVQEYYNGELVYDRYIPRIQDMNHPEVNDPEKMYVVDQFGIRLVYGEDRIWIK